MNVDDEYGRSSAAQFIEEAENNDLCLAFHEVWPQYYQKEDLLKLGKECEQSEIVLSRPTGC